MACEVGAGLSARVGRAIRVACGSIYRRTGVLQAVSVLGGSPTCASLSILRFGGRTARTDYRCSQIFYEVASSSVTLTAIQTCSYYILCSVRNTSRCRASYAFQRSQLQLWRSPTFEDFSSIVYSSRPYQGTVRWVRRSATNHQRCSTSLYSRSIRRVLNPDYEAPISPFDHRNQSAHIPTIH